MAEVRYIGRYELLGRIGQGGMGTVFKAFDPVLQRVVAVKIISAQLDQHPDARERFFREARAAGQLSHKNIVVVHDLGEHELQPYLAMEFLEGENLEVRMRTSGRIRFNRVLRLVTEICEGLEYAHNHGVLHRDIKPANLFLTDHGTLKILDFGLARLVSSELTHSQAVVGTANYMCPEQVRGERADQRSDIFSVGVVMYELLSGHKAFSGDSFATIVFKILQATPEPLHKFDESIPRQLVDIVDRALAKNREDRYQNMGEMLRDLAICEQMLLGSHPSAREPLGWPVLTNSDAMPTTVGASKPASAAKPVSASGRRLTWWVGAAVLIAVAGIGRIVWSPPTTSPEVDVAPPTPAVQSTPKPQAPVPTVTAPPAPRQELPTTPTATERSRADDALSRMAIAKAEAIAAGTGGPLAQQTMQEATAMERLGRAGYQRGRYADAAAQLYQAAALFRSAALAARTEAAAAAEQQKREEERRERDRREQERLEQQQREQERRAAEENARAADPPAASPPPEPPPPPIGPAAEAQIADLLTAYVDALEQRSVDALKRIWPGMEVGQERAIRNELSRARSVRVELTNQRVEVSGNSATATARRRYELQTDDGQQLSSETDTTFSLRKVGESWVIHGVVHRRR